MDLTRDVVVEMVEKRESQELETGRKSDLRGQLLVYKCYKTDCKGR